MRYYAIACMARVGGTWLSELLHSTGLLGNPREYLHHQDAAARKRRQGRIEKILKNNASANGVSGLRVVPSDVQYVTDLDPSWIHLHRNDTLGQAISMCRATEARQWRLNPGDKPVPWCEYSRDKVKGKLAIVERNAKNWSRVFGELGVQPCRVAYEDLLANPRGQIHRIATHLNVDITGCEIKSNLRIQRDDTTELWRQRYLEGK